MKRTFSFSTAIPAILLCMAVSIPAFAQTLHSSHHQDATVHHVFSHKLPPMNGNRLTTQIVEVTYAPGEFSAPHSHPCPVVVYVLSGAVRMQVKGQPEGVYRAGQTFFEEPNGIHEVSANASKTEPAKFLAYFVCDHETPLTVPVPGAMSPTPKNGGTNTQ